MKKFLPRNFSTKQKTRKYEVKVNEITNVGVNKTSEKCAQQKETIPRCDI